MNTHATEVPGFSAEYRLLTTNDLDEVSGAAAPVVAAAILGFGLGFFFGVFGANANQPLGPIFDEFIRQHGP